MFKAVYGREAVPEETKAHEGLGESKKTRMLRAIAARYGSNDCLFVGDTVSDLIAGEAAGWTTVGVTWGRYHTREDLLPFAKSAKHLVDSPAGLKRWLFGENQELDNV